MILFEVVGFSFDVNLFFIKRKFTKPNVLRYMHHINPQKLLPYLEMTPRPYTKSLSVANCLSLKYLKIDKDLSVQGVPKSLVHQNQKETNVLMLTEKCYCLRRSYRRSIGIGFGIFCFI